MSNRIEQWGAERNTGTKNLTIGSALVKSSAKIEMVGSGQPSHGNKGLWGRKLTWTWCRIVCWWYQYNFDLLSFDFVQMEIHYWFVHEFYLERRYGLIARFSSFLPRIAPSAMPSRVYGPTDPDSWDPLTNAISPPLDESAQEREIRIKHELEAKQKSDAIDEDLNRQRAAEKKGPKPVRVLLLGMFPFPLFKTWILTLLRPKWIRLVSWELSPGFDQHLVKENLLSWSSSS